MKIEDVLKEARKKRPKTFVKIENHWYHKIMHDVMSFSDVVMKHINPKAKKVLKRDEWLINGPEIELELWKLIKKARKLK